MNQEWESNNIYHYCSLSTALEYILPTMQLLLNNVGKANDPRENKSFVFASSNILSQGYFDMGKFNHEFTNELRKRCKVLCLSSDHAPYFGNEYSRLWALYGGNHKGVCIELDKEIFLKENQDKISGGAFKKVVYRKLDFKKIFPHISIDHDQIRMMGLSEYVNQFRVTHIDHLFFTKNEEWESEREYRVVYFSDKTEDEYCKISDCLKSINLGVDFNDVYLPAVKEICKGVPIFRMEFTDVRLTRVPLL